MAAVNQDLISKERKQRLAAVLANATNQPSVTPRSQVSLHAGKSLCQQHSTGQAGVRQRSRSPSGDPAAEQPVHKKPKLIEELEEVAEAAAIQAAYEAEQASLDAATKARASPTAWAVTSRKLAQWIADEARRKAVAAVDHARRVAERASAHEAAVWDAQHVDADYGHLLAEEELPPKLTWKGRGLRSRPSLKRTQSQEMQEAAESMPPPAAVQPPMQQAARPSLVDQQDASAPTTAAGHEQVHPFAPDASAWTGMPDASDQPLQPQGSMQQERHVQPTAPSSSAPLPGQSHLVQQQTGAPPVPAQAMQQSAAPQISPPLPHHLAPQLVVLPAHPPAVLLVPTTAAMPRQPAIASQPHPQLQQQSRANGHAGHAIAKQQEAAFAAQFAASQQQQHQHQQHLLQHGPILLPQDYRSLESNGDATQGRAHVPVMSQSISQAIASAQHAPQPAVTACATANHDTASHAWSTAPTACNPHAVDAARADLPHTTASDQQWAPPWPQLPLPPEHHHPAQRAASPPQMIDPGNPEIHRSMLQPGTYVIMAAEGQDAFTCLVLSPANVASDGVEQPCWVGRVERCDAGQMLMAWWIRTGPCGTWHPAHSWPELANKSASHDWMECSGQGVLAVFSGFTEDMQVPEEVLLQAEARLGLLMRMEQGEFLAQAEPQAPQALIMT